MNGLDNGVNVWKQVELMCTYNRGSQPTLASIMGLLPPLDKDRCDFS